MRRIVPIVLLLLLQHPDGTSVEASEQQVVWTDELHVLDAVVQRDIESGRVEWLPASVIESFLTLTQAELDLLGMKAEMQKEMQEILGLSDRTTLLGGDQSDSGDCVSARESGTMGPTSLILPTEVEGLAPRPTIAQLVDRSYLAVVLKITGIEAGVHGSGRLATRVVGEVLTFLHVDDALSGESLSTNKGASIEYFTRDYDLTVGEIRLCAERQDNGFFKEEIGDTVLLLGVPRGSASYQVVKIFPVVDGVVQPQPYEYVVEQPLVLGEIR